MRVHIELEDGIVAEIDRAAGPRGRSRFIREAIASALEHGKRRELIRSAPVPRKWSETATGEPMPDVVAAVRRSRLGH